MSYAKDSRKKKNRLQFQLVGFIVFLFLILNMIGIALMHNSSTTAFLSAKNDMIERDLARVTEYIKDTKGLEWYLDFWLSHPDEIGKEQTSEEITVLSEHEFYFDTDEETIEYLNSLPYSTQLAIAKDRYRVCRSTVNYERGTFGYGGLSLVDVTEDSYGFVYLDASEDIMPELSGELSYGHDW